MTDYEAAMRKFPVPGTIVRQWVIPARGHGAFTLKRGQVLRFVDVEGKQVPDVACFNEHDLTEHLNLGNSLLLNKRRELREDDVLYSVTCNPMMTIVGYSNGVSSSASPRGTAASCAVLLRSGISFSPPPRQRPSAGRTPR